MFYKFMTEYRNARTAINQIRRGEWKPIYNTTCRDHIHAERNGLELWLGNGPLFCEIRRGKYFGYFWRHYVWWAAARKLKRDADRAVPPLALKILEDRGLELTNAELFLNSLPAFVGESNQVAEFHRSLDAVRLDVQRRYVQFLAGDHSALEPMHLQEIVQALQSAATGIDRSPDASGSMPQERLLCLLVLQALSQFLVRGRSS